MIDPFGQVLEAQGGGQAGVLGGRPGGAWTGEVGLAGGDDHAVRPGELRRAEDRDLDAALRAWCRRTFIHRDVLPRAGTNARCTSPVRVLDDLRGRAGGNHLDMQPTGPSRSGEADVVIVTVHIDCAVGRKVGPGGGQACDGVQGGAGTVWCPRFLRRELDARERHHVHRVAIRGTALDVGGKRCQIVRTRRRCISPDRAVRGAVRRRGCQHAVAEFSIRSGVCGSDGRRTARVRRAQRGELTEQNLVGCGGRELVQVAGQPRCMRLPGQWRAQRQGRGRARRDRRAQRIRRVTCQHHRLSQGIDPRSLHAQAAHGGRRIGQPHSSLAGHRGQLHDRRGQAAGQTERAGERGGLVIQIQHVERHQTALLHRIGTRHVRFQRGLDVPSAGQLERGAARGHRDIVRPKLRRRTDRHKGAQVVCARRGDLADRDPRIAEIDRFGPRKCRASARNLDRDCPPEKRFARCDEVERRGLIPRRTRCARCSRRARRTCRARAIASRYRCSQNETESKRRSFHVVSP